MDEKELEEYLRQIDKVESVRMGDDALLDQLRDEEGIGVPGCYRTLPIPTED